MDGFILFILFPTALDSLWWGSFPAGCEDSVELQSPRSGCLPHPVCLRRCLAGTEQFSSAGGCYSGSLWTGRLDTCKTNIFFKKCSDFNKLKNIVQKNLAQDWSSLTMTFAVEPILPVRLPMLLKIIFLYSLFSCLQKSWDNQTKTKHMLESCWLMRKCWQFCRFYNLGIRNCSHDKSQE